MVLSTHLRAALFLTAVLAGAHPGPAQACAFHTSLPEKTLSQSIAESAVLVAARPNPDDPFRFSVMTLLKGEPGGAAPPFLVDTSTRRRLALAPDHAILFSRDLGGSWTRLMYLDETTLPVAEQLLALAAAWGSPDAAIERRRLASRLLANADPRLRRVALRELDSLDYSVLRKGSYPIDADTLLAEMSDIQDQAYAPIRILLLGLVGGDEARKESVRQLRWRLRLGIDNNLGVWATTAIALHGADGVAAFGEVLFEEQGVLSPRQTAEVVRALAIVSASGDPVHRMPIRDMLRRVVERAPAAAAMIPPALIAAADQYQVDLIRDLIAARAFTTRTDLLAATAYLSSAMGPEATLAPPRGIDRYGGRATSNAR